MKRCQARARHRNGARYVPGTVCDINDASVTQMS
jgi:hypothetical protein